MPPREAAPRGMTLIEILVVLLIIGLGWFTLLPNLGVREEGLGSDKALDAMNAFLGEVRTQAMRQGDIQKVDLKIGDVYMTWNNTAQTCKLPGQLSRLQINETALASKTFTLRVYPSGFMDSARMVLTNGEVFQAAPLAAVFERND